MKILPFIAAGAIVFASCSSNKIKNSDDSIATDTPLTDTAQVAAAAGEACFLHTDGTGNQDSTMVHLIINGSKVTGDMKWVPQQKDMRAGTLEGTQQGNTIQAVWRFMQEGMKDSLAVEFDFPGDKLAQKPYKVDANTGSQRTDTKAGYTVIYHKVSCK